MSLRTIIRIAALAAAWIGGNQAIAQPITVDEFRRELVGKALCTVHLPDGTAVLAGSGMIVRGIWEADNGHICRRNAHDPVDRRRCVDYERAGPNRFRNSDGVEFCIGPCAPPDSAGAGTGAR